METANERFKKIRKICKKTQEEWGDILGITRPGVSDIESGRRNVTEKHIKMLCSNSIDGKFINEEYLRTGVGDPFVDLGKKEEIFLLLGEALKGESKDYVERLSSALSKLSVNEWEILANIAETLVKQREPK